MAQITLIFAGKSNEIPPLARQFSDINIRSWAIGEKPDFQDEPHAYNYVQLLIGSGDYSAALRDAESWLTTRSNEIAQFAHFADDVAAVTLAFSIPYAPKEGTSGGRSVRVNYAIVQFCERHRMEIRFEVNHWPDA